MSKLRHSSSGGLLQGSLQWQYCQLPHCRDTGHNGSMAVLQHTSTGALQHCSMHHCTHVPHSIYLQFSVVIWFYSLCPGCGVWRPPAGTAMAAVTSGNTWLPDTSTGHTEAAGQPCHHASLTTPSQESGLNKLLNSGNLKWRKNDLWNISLLAMTSMA